MRGLMMSSETKFTKGEWYAHPNGVGCGGIAIVSTPNGCVLSKSEDNANADLISAAPSMYEELEDLEAWLKYHDDYKGWHARVKKLLKKARGENNVKS